MTTHFSLALVDVSTIIQMKPDCAEDRFCNLRKFLKTLDQRDDFAGSETLATRLEILDELDSLAGDLDVDEPTAGEDFELSTRVELLRSQLEGANLVLYQSAHNQIADHGHATLLAGWLKEMKAETPRPGLSFDLLDEIVSGVFQLHRPQGDNCPGPEMRDYQPTPVRHILDLIAVCKLTADDILFDLGSGLGHVPLLVSILTGIRTIGIEVQQNYTNSALLSAEHLRLDCVQFITDDARSAQLSQGSIFYLFTPFTGSILRDVLDRLHALSNTKQIRICSLGPCTGVLQNETWLTAMRQPDTERIAVFRSL